MQILKTAINICGAIFLSALWLSHDQLWVIIEETPHSSNFDPIHPMFSTPVRKTDYSNVFFLGETYMLYIIYWMIRVAGKIGIVQT